MRSKWVLAAVPTFGLACFGCFSSSDSQPGPDGGTPHLDSGPGPVVDATMPSGPDGSMPEAAVDGSVAPLPDARPEAAIEAGPQPVTVVVHSLLGPESGVTVVFQDASGAVLSTATTDALGSASALVPAGSQATAVMGTAASAQLTTIQGVAPGDVLAVYDASNDSPSAQLSIDLGPDSGPPPGAASFIAHVGQCTYGMSAFPTMFSLNSGYECQSQGTFPVLITSQAGAAGGYADLGYIYQKGNALATDGGVTNVVMTGAWSTTTGAQTVAISNTPTVATGQSLSAANSEVTGGVATPWISSASAVDDAGTTDYVFATHPGFADSLQGEAMVLQIHYPVLAVSGLATRGPAAQGDGGVTALDLGQSYPLLDQASINNASPGQPTIAWSSEAGAPAPADGVFVSFSWTAVNDAGAYVRGAWTIVTAPESTAVTAPALPAAVAAWAPGASASFVVVPSVVIVDADFITDYATLRAQAGSLPISANLIQGHSSPSVPPLPVDGTLKLTAITYSGD